MRILAAAIACLLLTVPAALAQLPATQVPLVGNVGGETPSEGSCDSTGRLVCAGASAGSNAGCTITPAGVASCTWSWGVLYGYTGLLPGQASAQWTYGIDASSSMGSFDSLDQGVDQASCLGLPVLGCGGGATDSGSLGPVQLLLGECLLVTVQSSVYTWAFAPPLLSQFTAGHLDNSEAGGQVCFVDDGR